MRTVDLVFRPAGWLLLLALAGCQSLYAPAPQILPPHIRTIGIRPVVNATQTTGLEEKLTIAITREFVNDRRLAVVDPGGADAGLTATIGRYIRQPVEYDVNQVPTQYELILYLHLEVVDQTKSPPEVLFQEKNMEARTRYFVGGGRTNVISTEEEAREELWRILARNVLKRTIEGFGTASGESERKVRSTAPTP